MRSSVLLYIIFGFVLSAFDMIILFDAYYLNLSMFFAFACLFPEARALLFFVIPIIFWVLLPIL